MGEIETKEMYCYVGDLLGFKNLLANLPSNEQSERVIDWIHLVEEGARKFELHKYHLVSDTIFAGGENNKDELEKLIDFSKYILESGVNLALPVRGAITFGEVAWHPKVTFGRAIVDAFNLANSQEWIGTSCSCALPHINDLWDSQKVLIYVPPMKNGETKIRPVVRWNVPAFIELMRNTVIEGLFKDGEVLTWSHANKIQNTIIFSLYLKKLKAIEMKIGPHKIDFGRKYGLLPIHILDLDDESLAMYAKSALEEPRPPCLVCKHPRFIEGKPFNCTKSNISFKNWEELLSKCRK